jgi:hypothetical protein
MYPEGSATSFQGIISTPMTPVMYPPARNEIFAGFRLAKSLAGETTLAAMFVASVAMPRQSSATTSTAGLRKRVTSTTGSQMVVPKITTVAEVTATPMKL